MIPYHLKETHGGGTHDGKLAADLSLETLMNFGKSVMIIAAADGELSTAERDEYLGMATAFGAPPPVIDAFREFDPKGKRLEDFLPVEYKPMIRLFIYDAIKVARVDGYHEAEKAAVRKAAAMAGVAESVVIAIEGLLEVEAALRTARITLLRSNA